MPIEILAISGSGRATSTNTTMLGDQNPSLSHEQWMVTHHQVRPDPEVVKALDANSDLLTDELLRPDRAQRDLHSLTWHFIAFLKREQHEILS